MSRLAKHIICALFYTWSFIYHETGNADDRDRAEIGSFSCMVQDTITRTYERKKKFPRKHSWYGDHKIGEDLKISFRLAPMGGRCDGACGFLIEFQRMPSLDTLIQFRDLDLRSLTNGQKFLRNLTPTNWQMQENYIQFSSEVLSVSNTTSRSSIMLRINVDDDLFGHIVSDSTGDPNIDSITLVSVYCPNAAYALKQAYAEILLRSR